MTDRKIVFERAVHNPDNATAPPPGWRFEYKDEKPKRRWFKLWYTNTRRWSSGSVYFAAVLEQRPNYTYAVSIDEDD